MTVSKLTLGTAQLGLNYGVANKQGKPSREECFKMLDFAFEHGITTFDTAAAYGDSEAIIGEWIKVNHCEPLIISKIPLFEAENLPKRQISLMVKDTVQCSLEALNVDRLWGVLLHSYTGKEKHFANVIKALNEMKSSAMVSHLGISLYTPTELFDSLAIGTFDTFQVPANIFDQRFLNGDVQAAKKEKYLFARSLYLQGLLTLSEKEAEEKVPGSGAYIHILSNLSKQYEVPVKNMAFSFLASFPFITSFVLGMESKKQVEENIHLLDCPQLPPNLFADIKRRFSSVPKEIIDPRTRNHER